MSAINAIMHQAVLKQNMWGPEITMIKRNVVCFCHRVMGSMVVNMYFRCKGIFMLLYYSFEPIRYIVIITHELRYDK